MPPAALTCTCGPTQRRISFEVVDRRAAGREPRRRLDERRAGCFGEPAARAPSAASSRYAFSRFTLTIAPLACATATTGGDVVANLSPPGRERSRPSSAPCRSHGRRARRGTLRLEGLRASVDELPCGNPTTVDTKTSEPPPGGRRRKRRRAGRTARGRDAVPARELDTGADGVGDRAPVAGASGRSSSRLARYVRFAHRRLGHGGENSGA